MEENFGIIKNEFVNLYSIDNPIMEEGEICYFLFQNTTDYHIPMVGKGLIMKDVFTDGMNKTYFIKILEILESPKIISEFIYQKTFELLPIRNGIIGVKKINPVSNKTGFDNHVLPIEAFFVRKTEDKIRELRSEYISCIKKDIQKQLKDIESLIY